jgi:lysozyme
MNISENGLRLICSFEGYHRELPNGDCTAYQERINGKLDRPTIGFGCTEGVKMGMVWTRAQAEEALKKELARFEAGVTQKVTVELNQNQFDALVSLAYNIGLGAFGTSTLLKKLNAGDYDGAVKQFERWNKFNGKSVKGLTSRRMREAALFLKPVEKPDEPFMPQAVEAAREPSKAAPVAAGIAAGGAASSIASQIPAPPTEVLTVVSGWQMAGETVKNFGVFAMTNWMLTAAIIGVVGVIWFLPKIRWEA